jgi:hypothetical protein
MASTAAVEIKFVTEQQTFRRARLYITRTRGSTAAVEFDFGEPSLDLTARATE